MNSTRFCAARSHGGTSVLRCVCIQPASKKTTMRARARFRVPQRVITLVVCLLLMLGARVPNAMALHAGAPVTTSFAFPMEAGDAPRSRPARQSAATTPGVNGIVQALAVDGSGMLYAGGDFTDAGGASANYVARWDGSSWMPLGGGTNTRVDALAVDGSGTLYAGGIFTSAGEVSANRVARWDGNTWAPLGSGMNGPVGTLLVDGSGTLYAGGGFTSAGGVDANFIARWDGSTWAPLGSGMNGEVSALAIDNNGALFAGGTFTTAGEASANSIARWDGNSWTPLGSGMTGNFGSLANVSALAVDNSGVLYAGGDFTSAGGVDANYIARWDGSTWAPLGNGVSNTNGWGVDALAMDGSGALYAGGMFTSAGGESANSIARWDGSTWEPLGSGMSGSMTMNHSIVRALKVDGGALYAGGDFTSAGGASAYNLARWDGSRWQSLPPSPSVMLAPNPVQFGSQPLAIPSPIQSVTLTNTGSTSLTISSISASGDFAHTTNCGGTLASGASCTIDVTFTPTALGDRTGTLTITDDAPGSPHTLPLPGWGTPHLLANPSFERDADANNAPDFWSANSNVTQSNTLVRSGVYSMQHTASDDASYSVYQVVTNLREGRTYDVSAWVNIPATADLFTFALAVQWRDTTNTVLSTSGIAAYTAATEGWERTTASLVAPAGTASAVVVMLVQDLGATIYVDDVTLHTGNLLRNSGFEWGTSAGGAPNYWSPDSHATRSNVLVHTGQYAIQHTAAVGEHANYSVYQVVPNIQPGQPYHCSAWVNIPYSTDRRSFFVGVQWFNANQVSTGNSIISRYNMKSW
jgi:hypothetical protein